MIRIRLPEAEAQALEAEVRSTEDRKLRDRLQIVLLAHQDRKHQDIAADFRINRRSVQRWLNAYCERGLAGLVPKKARGKAPGIPASMADEIKRWVIEGPAEQGLDRANWTHEELADHLRKAHGIETSRSAMHRFCRKLGIRPYRPTYRYLRGDKDKQAQAREDLAGLRKGRRRASSSC
ncbi:MAG: helix-turn-helix domain-containing protein [Gemmataceae bacterium]